MDFFDFFFLGLGQRIFHQLEFTYSIKHTKLAGGRTLQLRALNFNLAEKYFLYFTVL